MLSKVRFLRPEYLRETGTFVTRTSDIRRRSQDYGGLIGRYFTEYYRAVPDTLNHWLFCTESCSDA